MRAVRMGVRAGHCTLTSLSQRREFLDVVANEAGSAALLTELRMTTCRGQKVRQLVEKDGLAGQCQMPPTVARPPPARDMGNGRYHSGISV